MGNWTSFAHLEDEISLPELDALVKAKRDNDKGWRYFFGAIQGIDLAKNEGGDTEERLREVRRRAEARLTGDPEAGKKKDLAGIGFKVKSV